MQDILGGENLIFPYGYYAGYGIGFGAPYLLPTYIGDCSFDCSAADFSAGQLSIYRAVKQCKGGLTTRSDPPPNGLRELKLHRSSANGCTKRKIFLKIFFDIRFRS